MGDTLRLSQDKTGCWGGNDFKERYTVSKAIGVGKPFLTLSFIL